MKKVNNGNPSLGGSYNNYQFDFGLGAGTKGSSNAPLKEQKPAGSYSQPWSTPVAPRAAPTHTSTGWSQFQSSTSGWTGQSKPGSGTSGGSLGRGSLPTPQTWSDYKPMTQPVGGAKTIPSQPLGGARSMNAAGSSSYRPDNVAKFAAAGIAGVSETKSADVFGDLLGAAINRSNAPLNKITPKSSTSSFSMGNLGTTLPKATQEKPPGLHKTQERGPARQTTPISRTSKPAQPPARSNVSSSGGSPFPDISGGPSSSFEDDVFSFGRSSSAPASASNGSANDPFGLSGASGSSVGNGGDPFEFGSGSKTANPPIQKRASPAPMADPFDVFAQKQTPSTQRKRADPMDALFSKSTPPPPVVAQDDDWGVFGGGSSNGAGESKPDTTELEGLPPPPGGVTAESASDKGSEFYKSGQFPDAIKWLTWSIELSSGDKELTVKVLTCRGSCFKEIGEMKKAVADCTEAIEMKPKDTTLLMQRASLYESMEKYKLGVADLKLVTQLDPDNRLARGTLVRLQKMVEQ